MKALAILLFYGWSGALLLLGAVGMFNGRWEIERIFALDLDALGQERTATLLNQYRFLKAVEFGFGLFCFIFKDEIFTRRVFNRLFLWVVFLGAGARALSLLLEGLPHWSLTGITVLEFVSGIVIALHTRRSVGLQ
ncbi:MAG: DUF4345 family protein [Vicinamibacterales bacterium]